MMFAENMKNSPKSGMLIEFYRLPIESISLLGYG
jgi:hypothetical protein